MQMKLICQRCGHSWLPRVENPLFCPLCHSYKWNEKSEEKKVD